MGIKKKIQSCVQVQNSHIPCLFFRLSRLHVDLKKLFIFKVFSLIFILKILFLHNIDNIEQEIQFFIFRNRKVFCHFLFFNSQKLYLKNLVSALTRIYFKQSQVEAPSVSSKKDHHWSKIPKLCLGLKLPHSLFVLQIIQTSC